MSSKESLIETVQGLDEGVQLFIPADVAEAIYGIANAGKEVDKLARGNDCDLSVKQAGVHPTPELANSAVIAMREQSVRVAQKKGDRSILTSPLNSSAVLDLPECYPYILEEGQGQ